MIRLKKYKSKILVLIIILSIVASVIYLLLNLMERKRKIESDLRSVLNELKEEKGRLERHEFLKVVEGLEPLQKSIRNAKKTLKENSFISFIPKLGKSFTSTQALLNVGEITVQAAEPLAYKLEPFLTKGFEAKSRARREKIIADFLASYPKLRDDFKVLIEVVPKIRSEILTIDNQSLSEVLPNKDLEHSLGAIQEKLQNSEFSVVYLIDILNGVIEILGAEKSQKYLLIFQNNGELRATGGFITAYALLEFDKGRLQVLKNEDIYQLDNRVRSDIPSPEPIKKIEVNYLNSRDSNLSPDYPTSVKEFLKFYRKDGGIEPDIVMSVDLDVLTELVSLTGPIHLASYNQTFSSQLHSLGIPDIIYKVEEYTQLPESKAEKRKEVLGDLMFEIIEKLYGLPAENLIRLPEVLEKLASGKHILAYSENERKNNLFKVLSIDGEVKQKEGNYLHINHSNLGGRKSNLFVQETVEINFKVGSIGTITQEVKITLANNKNQDFWLNTKFLNWARVYVPEGSRLLGSSASGKVKSYSELGKQVFENYFYLDPGGSNSLYLEYQLPFKYDKKKGFPLYLQKQAGVKSTKFVINVNGKKWKELNLTKDEELRLKI